MSTRRTMLSALVGGLLAAGALAATAQPAAPQPAPQPAPQAGQGGQAPIRILVGFPPGGSIDLAARAVAEHMRGTLARPVVVENRPGASGRLALEAVKNAKPDGETLVASPSGPMTLFPHLYRSLRYDTLKDFSPVSTIAAFDYALSAGPAAPAKTVGEFRSWAQANAAKANYGTTGSGTPAHFAGVSFAQRTGIALTHVPYKGSGPAITDLVGGAVAAVVSPVTEAAEQHKAGRIRILATTGSTRSPLVPDVPTFRESGVDFELSSWFALFGPAGLPAATAQAYAKAVAAAVADPALAERLARAGLTATASTPGELDKAVRGEIAMWGPLVKASGFTPED